VPQIFCFEFVCDDFAVELIQHIFQNGAKCARHIFTSSPVASLTSKHTNWRLASQNLMQVRYKGYAPINFGVMFVPEQEVCKTILISQFGVDNLVSGMGRRKIWKIQPHPTTGSQFSHPHCGQHQICAVSERNSH
jgi:hypothetical protein